MGEGERVCGNGCNRDERDPCCVWRRRDPDNKGERRRGEGYEGRGRVDKGRFGVDDELVITGGNGKVDEVYQIRDGRQSLVIPGGWETRKDGDYGTVRAVEE